MTEVNAGIPNLGARLRAHRLSAGLSQAELAARMAVHPGLIGRIERNGQLPDRDRLEAFFSALRLAAEDAAELRGSFEDATAIGYDSASEAARVEPTVWNVPGRNVSFTGRDEVLADVHRQLAGGLRAVILPVALRGLGGVGKTQLALEYAHRFKADYDVVWWVDAEQLELIDVALARLAARMGLPSTGSAPDDARQAREALRLGEPYARWLLIFDNAAEPDDLLAYLPDPGAHGHLLLTSRDQTWAAHASTLEVDVFTRQESVARLTSAVRDLAPGDAESIAELLGDLPLAVESAAAWLATTGTPVDTYIEALAGETMRVLSLEQPRGYALPVAAVWSLSLKRLREQEPAAAHLLELASHMSPDGIATELFYSAAAIDELRRFDDRVTDALSIGTLVRAITRFSLMRADSNELRVHRLVQDAVRAQMEGVASDETVHAVHRILYAARPGPLKVDDPAEWPRYAQIWHHLLPSMAEFCDEQEVRELMIDRVRYLWSIGEYQRALRFARPIIERWETRIREDGPSYVELSAELGRQLLALQTEVASALRANGEIREAYKLDGAILARQMELLPARHPDTLTSSIMVAADLRALGYFASALARDKRTYEDLADVLGADHPRTLSQANNVAVSHRLVGDFAEAYRIDQDVFARRRSVLGRRHPDTLHSRAQCGFALAIAGRYDEAVPVLVEGATGLIESFGPARPRTLVATTSLAWALLKAGRPAEALARAQETHAQYTATYEPYHPGALLCRMVLAAAMSASGSAHYGDAVRVALAAVAGFEDRFGATHPSTLASMNNAAVYERRAGNADQAQVVLERTVEGLKEHLGHHHPNTYAASANLANCLADSGRLNEAERLERQAIEGLTAALGADHPDTAAVSRNLAITVRALGRRREARAIRGGPPSRSRLDLELPPISL